MVKGFFKAAGFLKGGVKFHRGLSLVEALVALMILTIVSTGIVLMSLQILALSYSSKLKNQSVSFAEDMIEQVRNFYQVNSWGALSNYGKNGTQCYINLSWNPPSAGSCVSDCSNNALLIPGQSTFYRYLQLTTTGTTSILVSVVVTWKDRGVCKLPTRIDTYYYNY